MITQIVEANNIHLSVTDRRIESETSRFYNNNNEEVEIVWNEKQNKNDQPVTVKPLQSR